MEIKNIFEKYLVCAGCRAHLKRTGTPGEYLCEGCGYKFSSIEGVPDLKTETKKGFELGEDIKLRGKVLIVASAPAEMVLRALGSISSRGIDNITVLSSKKDKVLMSGCPSRPEVMTAGKVFLSSRFDAVVFVSHPSGAYWNLKLLSVMTKAGAYYRYLPDCRLTVMEPRELLSRIFGRITGSMNIFTRGPLAAYKRRYDRKKFYKALRGKDSEKEISLRYKVIHEGLKHDRPLAIDLGCGSGTKSLLLSKLGYRTAGLDLNRHGYWNAASSEIFFATADIQRIPFTDSSFDLVVSFLSLGQCYDDREAVSESFRVLKKGGRALFQLTNKENLFSALRKKRLDPDSFREYTASDAVRIFREAGFTVERIWGERAYLPVFKDMFNYVGSIFPPFDRILSNMVPPGRRGCINVELKK